MTLDENNRPSGDEHTPYAPRTSEIPQSASNQPVPPSNATAAQPDWQPARNPGHTTQQPPMNPAGVSGGAAGAAAAPAKKKAERKAKPGIRSFLGGLLGAALACVLVLGATGNLGNGGLAAQTVELGSGTDTTINVTGGKDTLAETVAQKDLPSVVCIYVYSKNQGHGFFGGVADESETESGLGSGVILSKDGYILTNYHVIEDASSLKVSVNGETLDAKVIGTDASSDLAVIKVNATGLTPIEVGSSSNLKVGEWVMAIGSPYGMEQSVSTGIISATSRSSASLQAQDSTAVYTNMIQTDAAINPGNSGGALVDGNGKLIGINTMIASNSSSNSGVGFAIPVDYAMSIAKQLIKGETPSHAQMGVSLATVTKQAARQYDLGVDAGAYINSVSADSGAEKAGLKEGDIITKVDSTKVTSASDVIITVRSHKPGDKVTVQFNRDGKTQTTEVTLGKDTDNASN